MVSPKQHGQANQKLQHTGLLAGFWRWYERHYLFNLILTTGLFLLQLVHLYWLTTHVVAQGLIGQSLFSPPPLWQYLIVIVDYTEIPALISMSVFYLYELKKEFAWKHIGFLIMLNSQWLHLFWITDNFVVNTFHGIDNGNLPVWLAWVAILIDYLELPVIVDTLRRVVKELRKGNLEKALEAVKEGD